MTRMQMSVSGPCHASVPQPGGARQTQPQPHMQQPQPQPTSLMRCERVARAVASGGTPAMPAACM